MIVKTPKFWYRPDESPAPALEKALAPISALYKLGYALHQNAHEARSAPMPVICIGNIVAGGTGKTPTALSLMNVIRRHEIARKPYFLIRGYGGGEIGPLVVEPSKHTAWDTGDEALILARAAPTVVAIDRAAGAELAGKKGADLVLMDDGLQNPGIKKDISMVVINGDMGFGNQKIMPAGPLREPMDEGMARADAFILIGADHRNIRAKLPPGKPVFTATLEADAARLPPRDKKYLAFAGLGYPQKFFAFLTDTLKYELAGTERFPDHYPYTAEDLERLTAKARSAGAGLLTTEKDFMRLPKAGAEIVHTLPVVLTWADEAALVAFLKQKLAAFAS